MATQQTFVGSQSWKREVKERLKLHNLRIDRVVIRSELKYLVGPKIVNLKCQLFGGKTSALLMVQVCRVVRPVAMVWFQVELDPEPTQHFGPVANTITGQIVWIKGWLTGSWMHCRGDGIAARYALEFIDGHISMCGAVFILHILQNGLLVLGNIGCLVLRIVIHSRVPLSKWSQLPERIEDMCRNEKHACPWRHFNRVFG